MSEQGQALDSAPRYPMRLLAGELTALLHGALWMAYIALITWPLSFDGDASRWLLGFGAVGVLRLLTFPRIRRQHRTFWLPESHRPPIPERSSMEALAEAHRTSAGFRRRHPDAQARYAEEVEMERARFRVRKQLLGDPYSSSIPLRSKGLKKIRIPGFGPV